MELKEILAISGAPGLYKYVAQGKSGIIVEALADGHRTMVGGTTKVSALGDIAVFTQSSEVPLSDVFQSVYDHQAGRPVALTSKSSPDELKGFMSSVLPDYDTERVHNSDIKKIAQWYNALIGAGMTSFKASDEEAGEAKAEEAVAEAPKKKTTTRKTSATAAASKQRAPKAESRPKAPSARSTTARKAQ